MMSSKNSSNWVRKRILEELYDFYNIVIERCWLDRAILLKYLNVSEELLDSNILYLEEKKLVDLRRDHDSVFQNAVITAYGIDVIERKDKYAHEFPFLNIDIQEKKGDV